MPAGQSNVFPDGCFNIDIFRNRDYNICDCRQSSALHGFRQGMRGDAYKILENNIFGFLAPFNPIIQGEKGHLGRAVIKI